MRKYDIECEPGYIGDNCSLVVNAKNVVSALLTTIVTQQEGAYNSTNVNSDVSGRFFFKAVKGWEYNIKDSRNDAFFKIV